jgi:DNA repair photolyase
MRWDGLRLPDSTVRTFDAPRFRGITCHEVRAKSILTRAPAGMFEWTMSLYRGCTVGCRYCYARRRHPHLGFDAGLDFDTQIVVKVNAAELLRRELTAGRSGRIAVGANADCYQRVEGRYRLMPGVLAALTEHRASFVVATKNTMVLRDKDLLARAAEVAPVTVAVSISTLDRELAAAIEPGAPPPDKRIELCLSLASAGVPTAVMLAPIVPFLSDSPAGLRAAVRAAADVGATYLDADVLNLRPGAREWFLTWLADHHPGLVPRYRALYAGGAHPPRWYRDRILDLVHTLADECGVPARPAFEYRPRTASASRDSDQLPLW